MPFMPNYYFFGSNNVYILQVLKFKDPAQEADDTNSNYSSSYKGQEAYRTDIRRTGFTVEFLILALDRGDWSALCHKKGLPRKVDRKLSWATSSCQPQKCSNPSLKNLKQ
jgi:hypothetical protein